MTASLDESYAMGKIAGLQVATDTFIQAMRAAHAVSAREIARLRHENEQRSGISGQNEAA